jgi:hypothetical protein
MSLQRSTIGVHHDLLQFSQTSGPACSAGFLVTQGPLAPCGSDHILHFPHTAEQDSQPTISLIGKQDVPYRTRGGTYCPRVSTPKTRSLADLSMTIHIT